MKGTIVEIKEDVVVIRGVDERGKVSMIELPNEPNVDFRMGDELQLDEWNNEWHITEHERKNSAKRFSFKFFLISFIIIFLLDKFVF